MKLHLGKGRASVEHFRVVHVPSCFKDCGAKIIKIINTSNAILLNNCQFF